MQARYLFTNCTILDGTGSPSWVGEVAVDEGRILALGPKLESVSTGERIDGRLRVLCPGFIDIHGHSDLEVLRRPIMLPKLNQGITTEVAGNCGQGVFPCIPGLVQRKLEALVRDVLGTYPLPWSWYDLSTYLAQVAQQGSGTNLLFLQAHAPLRLSAIEGNPNRPATVRELETMVALLEESYAQGALGFSSGLYYAPCLFASAEEFEALLRVTARHDRLFAVHHRCEGSDVLQSLHEVLDLAERTGVRIELSHLKVIGRKNQDKVPRMLELIEAYHSRGVRVIFDQYPYEYGSTSLASLLPPSFLKLDRPQLLEVLSSTAGRARVRAEMEVPHGWDSIFELCGWEDISIVSLDTNPQYNGLDFPTIAAVRQQDPFDSFFDLVAEEQGAALMVDITQTQQSLETIMRHPLGCFSTDALYSGSGGHPRSWQAARHLLDAYQRQKAVLPLPQQIRRMTGEPAARLGVCERGLVREGFAADLVLLDMERMIDVSSLACPNAPGGGIDLVMVNGEVAYRDGVPTGALAGKLLRPRNG